MIVWKMLILRENSRLAERVLAALQKEGLSDEEVSTGQFVVNPRWSQRPRNAPADWQAKIEGYSVTNSVRVTTRKIDQVGRIIAVGVKAGSNTVTGLYFDLVDPRQYRQEAIRAAMERAEEDARVLAEAAGYKLGRVVSLNLDHARSQDVFLSEVKMFRSADMEAPPVVPGDVSVNASVTAVYELE